MMLSLFILVPMRNSVQVEGLYIVSMYTLYEMFDIPMLIWSTHVAADDLVCVIASSSVSMILGALAKQFPILLVNKSQ